jgi:hypothetical protein
MADFAALVAVASVEAWLAHAALLCFPCKQHLPGEASWQVVELRDQPDERRQAAGCPREIVDDRQAGRRTG